MWLLSTVRVAGQWRRLSSYLSQPSGSCQGSVWGCGGSWPHRCSGEIWTDMVRPRPPTLLHSFCVLACVFVFWVPHWQIPSQSQSWHINRKIAHCVHLSVISFNLACDHRGDSSGCDYFTDPATCNLFLPSNPSHTATYFGNPTLYVNTRPTVGNRNAFLNDIFFSGSHFDSQWIMTKWQIGKSSWRLNNVQGRCLKFTWGDSTWCKTLNNWYDQKEKKEREKKYRNS